MKDDSLFYNLRKPPHTVSIAWADEEVVSGVDNICPKFGDEHFLGNLRGGDIAIILPSSNVKDFTWTWYSELLVTDNVLQIFQDAKLTGFKTRQVTVSKVKRKGNKPVPKLWEIVVTGNGGEADPACGVALRYKCDYCKYRVYSPYQDNGIIVDPNNWNGTDFFTVNAYPKYILVTEKVKEVVEKNKLKGCVFIPSTKISHTDFVKNFFKNMDIKIIGRE